MKDIKEFLITEDSNMSLWSIEFDYGCHFAIAKNEDDALNVFFGYNPAKHNEHMLREIIKVDGVKASGKSRLLYGYEE